MDRKGWIILILCSVGLVFTWKNSVDRAEKQRLENAKNKQVVEEAASQENAVGSDAVENTNSEVAPIQPEVEAREDEPFVLTARVGDQELVRYTFSSFGGGIKTAEMLNEKKVFEEGNVLLNERGSEVIGALAKSYKEVENTYYERIAEGADSVQYQATLKDGTVVTKSWKIKHGDEKVAPKIHLALSFKAPAGKSIQLDQYSITTGVAVALFEREQVIHSGWFYYEDGDYKHEQNGEFKDGFFSDGKPVANVKVENIEYFGVDNQFFGTAIFPLADAKGVNLWASGEKLPNDKRWVYLVGLELPNKVLNGGETSTFGYDLFVGPKLNKRMGSISENSDYIMHFSRFAFFAWISEGMSWALNQIQRWFGGVPFSWGYAIILLTMFIRILIWPLHNKSTRTMKRMSKLQPMMKDLKEKYSDNPQKLNKETMKLYKEYKVNPMGGCLPMLVQIPIFFGVFNMINAAVELRGEPFFWVGDLSQPDHIGSLFGIPIHLLPILMAVTMVLQMRMTPQTGDKLQRRIFMLMPLMFFVFCYNYAAALALYWTTQNVISIGQTWLMHRLPEPELEKKVVKANKSARVGEVVDVDPAKPRKKGFMEKVAEKMEKMYEEREAAAGKTPAKKSAQPGQQTKKAKKRTPKTGG